MAFIPSDTRFPLQWHLLNTTPGEYDLNVVDVWDDYDGSGIIVAGLDAGFDYNHPDYDNYRTDLDWDFENNDSIALPEPDPDLTDDTDVDAHGTPILGIVGAAQDGVGTVGIAFGAELVGYKTDWSRDEVEAAIERATRDNLDIITMSYGEGSGNMFVHRDDLVDAAETAAEDGRDGKGLIIVKSAGNSRRDANNAFREETTGEALENSRHTVVVAGVSDEGELPPIANQIGDPSDSENKSSSPGANILTTAFYGREGDSVQTTDITGAQGYSSGDYTGFTGTSAAAPQVAGVIALILDANPTLGWRDVQDIIAYSSRHIGSTMGAAPIGEEQGTQPNGATWFWNAADNWNGGGLHYSNDYGFGLIDAKAAVRLAETWTTQKTSANEVNPARVDGLDREVTIAAGSTSGGANFFSMRFSNGIQIENITLAINFVEVANLNDLEVYLTSPGGTRVQLIADTGWFGEFSGSWRFGSTAFRGESSAGVWRLEVRDDDNAVSSPITINDIDLWMHGSAETEDDLFIFTNEFVLYGGVEGHSTNFDGGVGHDIINAAAVDGSIRIDLMAGTGDIAGRQLTMSGIEDVFGGDGNDRLTDGVGVNLLRGGRGNDTLRDSAAGGSDTFRGNQGRDTVEVTSAIGSDALYGGQGRDLIDWSESGETSATFDLVAGEARDTDGNSEVMRSFADLIGTERADTIIENNSRNVIDGHGGNDTLIVSSIIRSDVFRGGTGRDTIDWSGVNEQNARFDLGSGTARDSDGNTEIMESFENLIGTENNDVIIESGAVNVIDARGGDDIVRVTTLIGDDSFTGGFGIDSIDWSASAQNGGVYDLVLGTARAGNEVETMFGFENFFGTNQSDTIIEGAGVNAINAGAGNDIVRATSLIGNDTINGGTGIDTIDWSGSAQAGGRFDLAGNVATASAGSEAMINFENLIGTGQSDTIIESATHNVVDAGSGDDTLMVTSLIDGDSFTGGFGIDTINWSLSAQAGGVYDMSGGTARFGFLSEMMFGFENFIGTDQNDRIIEGAGLNEIRASFGDDIVEVTTLIGGDSFHGGAGDDIIDWSGSAQEDGIYDLHFGVARFGRQSETMVSFETFIGTDQDDRVIQGNLTHLIHTGSGDDTIEARLAVHATDFNGGAGIDHIDWHDAFETNGRFDLAAGTAQGAGGTSVSMANFEDLTGTVFADTIRGSNGDNILEGMDGDDRIFGRGGGDRILGGAGDDDLRGGGGDDFIFDGDGIDRMRGANGDDVFDLIADDFVDRIRDFTIGSDQIRLLGFGFDDLTITDLASGHVRVRYGEDRLILRDADDTLSASDLTEAAFLFA
ncbi:S8 family serine peptidase [Sedimentitalea arenosa]|uniref:S8 family serine peptidase n=1 Tax=Sedimentitalea arenosa TaxID=2798803 RepID=A0A8J7J9P8_9RHOB|nr:S8 family serine peptidase [Arenibacterium arenosum]MBJ6373417.1 S8 family serine peptidase [Arenibacterium arenosum]